MDVADLHQQIIANIKVAYPIACGRPWLIYVADTAYHVITVAHISGVGPRSELHVSSVCKWSHHHGKLVAVATGKAKREVKDSLVHLLETTGDMLVKLREEGKIAPVMDFKTEETDHGYFIRDVVE